jgi:Flp pilus assembly pilin Flp
MLSSITRFLRDEEGATAIEYGIIAGLISIAIVTSFDEPWHNAQRQIFTTTASHCRARWHSRPNF